MAPRRATPAKTTQPKKKSEPKPKAKPKTESKKRKSIVDDPIPVLPDKEKAAYTAKWKDMIESWLWFDSFTKCLFVRYLVPLLYQYHCIIY